MAKWFRTEAAGELTHMGLFVDYLNDRDYQAKFSTIEAPASDWDNPVAAFDQVRSQEHKLMQRMNDLIDLADKHNDHLTHSFITQFVPQQIADSAEADDVHDRSVEAHHTALLRRGRKQDQRDRSGRKTKNISIRS